MSRNGLGKMKAALELEAAYGCGRDTLIGLHTLVLSCNQLQVKTRLRPVLYSVPRLTERLVLHGQHTLLYTIVFNGCFIFRCEYDATFQDPLAFAD